MRGVGAILLATCSFWFISQPALAEKRVSLVIGNSAYKNVSQLQNPANDAAAVVAMFKRAGFDSVDAKLDLNIGDMRRALREFGNKARDADVAVIYYAGHGIELDGTNYLIPVDATLETDTDVLDETFALDRVLFAVEPAKQLRLVILDACRDNPFAKKMKRTVGSRAIGRGLAKVEPSSPNTMIAFAAKAGSTASDGDGKNSPFATALINHLPKPGLDVRKAFGFVRDDVLKATNNSQEPFVYGSLGGNDVMLVPLPAAVAPADKDATMRRDYEFADRVGTKPVWDAFIEKYPAGFFTTLAKAQRDTLIAEATRLEATAKAKAAKEEQARLAIEGAKAAEQAKAAERATAAEGARVTAEIAKKAEETKILEAERVKAASLARAAEIEAERVKVAEQLNAAAEAKATAEREAKENKVASLTSSSVSSEPVSEPGLASSMQSELKRVGCYTGKLDTNWTVSSQRALELFNKHADTKLSITIAGLDALQVVKSKPSRVCPLICDRGYRVDSERCVKISCGAGWFVNDDNECKKKRKASAPLRPSQVIRQSQNTPSRAASTISSATPVRPLYRQNECPAAGMFMSGGCPKR